jgi:hypothetical protein
MPAQQLLAIAGPLLTALGAGLLAYDILRNPLRAIHRQLFATRSTWPKSSHGYASAMTDTSAAATSSRFAHQLRQLRPHPVHLGFDGGLRVVAQREVMTVRLDRARAVPYERREAAFLPQEIR